MLGTSPAEQAVATYLGWVEAGEMPDDEVLGRFYADTADLRLFVRGFFAERAPDLRGCEVVDVEYAEAWTTVVVAGATGVRWNLTVILEDDGRVRGLYPYRRAVDGVVVRRAEAADGAALAELCRRVAITTPGRRAWFDYGDDYLTATAGPARDVLVAELDGQIVGLRSDAYRDVNVAGRAAQVGYSRHARIDPIAQGTGVFSAMNGTSLIGRTLRTPYVHSIVAVGNDPMLAKTPSNRQSSEIHRRFHLSCRDLATDAASHERAPDPKEVAAILRASLQDHVLAEPMGPSVIARRLGTLPTYGAHRVVARGGAVLGVPERKIQTIVEHDDGRRHETVQTIALDVGCTPGSGADLVALVGSWCGRLADEGVDELCIAATAGTDVDLALSPLAGDTTDYTVMLSLGRIDIGDTPRVYVDQALI